MATLVANLFFLKFRIIQSPTTPSPKPKKQIGARGREVGPKAQSPNCSFKAMNVDSSGERSFGCKKKTQCAGTQQLRLLTADQKGADPELSEEHKRGDVAMAPPLESFQQLFSSFSAAFQQLFSSFSAAFQ